MSENAVAKTAEPPGRPRPTNKLKGPERAAVLLLALGEEYGAPIWKGLDENEVRTISHAMSRLGQVTPDMMEELIVDFVTNVSAKGGIMGTAEATEKLLGTFMPKEHVDAIMEEIRGLAGRTMWEKLSNVQEGLLANYLKNEYPQTAAVVISKLRTDYAARVLAHLPEEFALDVMERMLRMEAVQKDILDKLEATLRQEFVAGLSHTRRRDAHEQMAEIFNSFDRQTESRFLNSLEGRSPSSAERIKALMFTFDDLGSLDAASVQTLLRAVDKDKLAIALKGANETMRTLFFGNMSQRAATAMKEDLEAMGPVRLKDVDEAQAAMVNTAKDMAGRGEIMINKNKSEDEFVY